MNITRDAAPFDLGNGSYGVVVQGVDVLLKSHGGKPVVEFLVHCEPCHLCNEEGGAIYADWWTVTEALQIVDDMEPVPHRRHIRIVSEQKEAWMAEPLPEGGWKHTRLTIPGDPADLIGNYLVILERRDDEQP